MKAIRAWPVFFESTSIGFWAFAIPSFGKPVIEEIFAKIDSIFGEDIGLQSK